jgi:outer membrane receptor protein involved in Fe transport
VTDVGQPPKATPIDIGSFAGTYRFTGRLNGLSFHLRASYVGRSYPFSTQTTFQRTIVAPGYYTVDPGITYAWRTESRIRQSIRLSARNVLNRDYVTPDYSLGRERSFYVSYAIEH